MLWDRVGCTEKVQPISVYIDINIRFSDGRGYNEIVF